MRYHLPVLFLLTPKDCHLTVVVLSTDRVCASRFTFSFPSHLSSDQSHSFIYPFHLSLSYYRLTQVTPSYIYFTLLFLIIDRPKSLLHIPFSPFSFLLLSNPSHSFVYPFHLFLHFPMPISSSKPRARKFTLSLCPDPRRACLFTHHRVLRPFVHRGLRATSTAYHYFCPGFRSFVHMQLQPIIISTSNFVHSRNTVYMQAAPAYSIISAPNFAHSCTMVYTQLQPIPLFPGFGYSPTTVYMQPQPISLSLPRTSLNRAPRFTRSSAYYCTLRLLFHTDASPRTDLHPQHRSLEAHDIHARSVHNSSYAFIHYAIS
ncbi:uncharacterized protein HD556DRAFT_713836 [Suillus plorans]|uniref:Uncharacterized protein n=1 Tax=Suillus plorans TaxID=116603 RepID=A0A9P7DTH1_9AGAM|nr:uncharacterized protein HD556DRAFT_713836 [Suillus plorans]KAG1802778.1 hypothetical protein HD556DRAFT_713836 [Suillus plorans]